MKTMCFLKTVGVSVLLNIRITTFVSPTLVTCLKQTITQTIAGLVGTQTTACTCSIPWNCATKQSLWATRHTRKELCPVIICAMFHKTCFMLSLKRCFPLPWRWLCVLLDLQANQSLALVVCSHIKQDQTCFAWWHKTSQPCTKKDIANACCAHAIVRQLNLFFMISKLTKVYMSQEYFTLDDKLRLCFFNQPQPSQRSSTCRHLLEQSMSSLRLISWWEDPSQPTSLLAARDGLSSGSTLDQTLVTRLSLSPPMIPFWKIELIYSIKTHNLTQMSLAQCSTACCESR